MAGRAGARVAWSLCAMCVALSAAGVVLFVLNGSSAVPATFGSRGAAVATNVAFLAFPIFGGLIASRRPDNPLWWIFSAVGVSAALWLFCDAYAVRALFAEPGSLPGGRAAAWLGNLVWVPGWGFAVLLYLLFPNGRLPSARWRPVAWASAVGTALLTGGLALAAGPLRDYPYAVNPIGLTAVPADSEQVGILSFLFFAAVGVAAVSSLLFRLRRATGVERQQLKWLLYAGVMAATGIAVWALLRPLGVRSPAGEELATLTRAAIPLAAGTAILRFRLYDIDVVINKTLVLGGLALFITTAYAAIVVGVGTLVGRGQERNLALSVAATAVVAVAFQPIRERLERMANRLVYGVRATPYEVLSRFSTRMGETVEPEQLLARMARLLAEGTGARDAQVWLRVGARLRPAAAWPLEGPLAPDDRRSRAVPLSEERLPPFDGVDRAVAVVHDGELLGALTVTKPRNEPLTPVDDKLLSDLAAQAGLVLRNVRLTAELMDRLEELRASRQRLVTAQDQARRRLERNLHDGAQQQLIALKIKLGLARATAEREHATAAVALLGQLAVEADDAIDTLRDLARGIYPPLLASEGLAVALASQAGRAPLPIAVDARGVGRYAQDIEAAVYFCCLEALQNVVKHAGARSASVTLTPVDGGLRFAVADDGCGLGAEVAMGAGLTNMTDRLDALGGALTILSAPGEGCTIVGRLPAEPFAAHPPAALGRRRQDGLALR